MRLLVALLLAIAAGQMMSVPARAQPATLETPPTLQAPPMLEDPGASGTFAPPTLAPATQPETLTPEKLAPAPKAPTAQVPDLTPDDIKPRTYGLTPPPTQEQGQSTINPRLEPWQKKDDRADRARQAQIIFAKLPFEIQNQILAETQEAHRQCNVYATYAQFHDCDCVGSVFFDERTLDPESSKDAIIARIARQCVSLPGASAYGYSQCHAGMRFVLVPQRAEDFCKCYAIEFGKNYERSPYPDFDNLRALGKRTNSYCIRTVPYAFKNQIKR